MGIICSFKIRDHSEILADTLSLSASGISSSSTCTATSVVAKVFKWIGGEDGLSDASFDLEAYIVARAELEAGEK